ncbi:MAG: DUF4440 domain-containing protein [Cyclobacteriaceae bacterium]
MKKLAFIPFILVFACQPAAPPCECGITGDDIVAIREQEQNFVQAVFAADQNKIAAVVADNIVAMPPNSPEIHGKNDYVVAMSSIGTILEFEFLEVEIEGGKDMAYAKGNYVMDFEMDGVEIGDEGSFVEIWKKEEDGIWRLYRDIWNSGTPLVTNDSTLLDN